MVNLHRRVLLTILDVRLTTGARMEQLAGRIAVVTGAGRGIGRAIALRFAEEGADIVCVSRTRENAQNVADEIKSKGRKSWAYAVDVADPNAVAAAADAILEAAGKVDVLVNKVLLQQQ